MQKYITRDTQISKKSNLSVHVREKSPEMVDEGRRLRLRSKGIVIGGDRGWGWWRPRRREPYGGRRRRRRRGRRVANSLWNRRSCWKVFKYGSLTAHYGRHVSAPSARWFPSSTLWALDPHPTSPSSCSCSSPLRFRSTATLCSRFPIYRNRQSLLINNFPSFVFPEVEIEI